jgi:hypothetical protein
MGFSHVFGSLFAGRQCLCARWHSFNRQLPSVFQSSCLCTRSCSRFPIAPIGDTTHIFLVVCTGRRCPCRWWLSDHLIVHHQWEYSFLCARSSSKAPNAPMGDSRFARCLQGGGVYVGGGAVSIVNSQIYSNTAYYVRAHLHHFPSGPPWDALL